MKLPDDDRVTALLFLALFLVVWAVHFLYVLAAMREAAP